MFQIIYKKEERKKSDLTHQSTPPLIVTPVPLDLVQAKDLVVP